MNSTYTRTTTYTNTDVENVFRRLSADFNMIADSTSAISRKEVSDYVNDLYLFAVGDVLKEIDVTLLEGYQEIRAIRYTIDTQGRISSNERPGGVLWPYCPFGRVRIIIYYRNTAALEDIRRIKQNCKISWGPSDENCSHESLNSNDGREYSSSGFGIKRKDWR